MPSVTTPFGMIEALPGSEYHASGTVRSCIAAEFCALQTEYGELIPQFTGNTLRKRQLPSISFHENGMLRLLPLEEQTMISTPIGPMPAELLGFYENGALKRVFPLNGRLSGYWSQEDEAELASPLKIQTPLGAIEALVICAYFSPQGTLRSLTLWPGTGLDVPHRSTSIAARIGVSFYDSGEVKSLEPAHPGAVPTPLGELLAFNPDAVGISGDSNSLRFAKDGTILGLGTVSHTFTISSEDGGTRHISPPLRNSYCDGETPEPTPLFLDFAEDSVFFSAEGMDTVTAKLNHVSASRFFPPLPMLAPACGLNSSFM
ncbi:hypothetical protein [Desulfovibrio ferrophilus]|uniref:Uncharacterized protein n=1 Tax=Desulfovibrio ferrophilus TaxID=241368 RepID=A0A2Z6B146_9BACT|nr:hypothetical protein [Desulfovibrio ferrophilus]BBD09239.1 uncharacterized protein DFE_2513 [Desulfovibrio ferrophilus]